MRPPPVRLGETQNHWICPWLHNLGKGFQAGNQTVTGDNFTGGHNQVTNGATLHKQLSPHAILHGLVLITVERTGKIRLVIRLVLNLVIRLIHDQFCAFLR